MPVNDFRYVDDWWQLFHNQAEPLLLLNDNPLVQNANVNLLQNTNDNLLPDLPEDLPPLLEESYDDDEDTIFYDDNEDEPNFFFLENQTPQLFDRSPNPKSVLAKAA